MASVFVYLRVSTQEQVDSGAGLHAQRDACAAWCHQHAAGFEFGGFFADQGVSGGSPDRPAFLELLQVVKLGDVVLVAKRDRLARDVLLARLLEREIENKGAVLKSAAGEGTDGNEPADKLQRGLIDLFSEYERALIQSRVKAAMKAKKARGQRVGAIPYGAQLSAPKQLEANLTEVQTIKRARELRAEGLSLREVAEALAAEGRLARNGKRFQATQINRMVNHA